MKHRVPNFRSLGSWLKEMVAVVPSPIVVRSQPARGLDREGGTPLFFFRARSHVFPQPFHETWLKRSFAGSGVDGANLFFVCHRIVC